MLRAISSAAIALVLLAAPAMARAPQRLLENGYYKNVSGRHVHRPAHTSDNQAPARASARCADGSFSFSEHRRGTCSHHGGVAKWL